MRFTFLMMFVLSIVTLQGNAQPGAIDPTFNPSDLGFSNGVGPNDFIFNTLVQSDGKVIVCGNFTSYNGTSVNRITRLNSNGLLDPSFQPGLGANASIRSIVLQSDGKIIIAGQFTTYNGINRSRIARLNADGTLDVSFNPGSGANNEVISLALQNDGKILIGGRFTLYNGTSSVGLARLNTDGSLDTSFITGTGTGASSSVSAIIIQPDGKIVIGGLFLSYNGITRGRIARLNSDGTLDTTYNTAFGFSEFGSGVNSMVLQSDGKIVVGGGFTSYKSSLVNYITRLNTDGSPDNSFNSGTAANEWVHNLALQSDGKILLCGFFTRYNGADTRRIARLNSDGTLDASFNTSIGADNRVQTISIQSDGKMIIGGGMSSYNGVSRNRLARLNTDGSLDPVFNAATGANGYIAATALQSDGKIFIGGNFTNFNGTVRNSIARLNSSGVLDASFDPGVGANGSVDAIAVQGNGNIVVGGTFTSYNGLL